MPLKGLFFCLLSLCIFFISCHKPNTLFNSLSSSQTNIHFENKLENKHLFNILYYLYFYNGGGVATGDVNNDGLPDIYFTANSKGNNKLYLNKGNFKFEDITEKAGVAGTSDWCTGVTMADVNGDGFLDIYVSSVNNRYGLKGNNELFINNGDNTFNESASKYGLDVSCFTTQSAFFDYDHDGDLDCYILNQSHNPHSNITDTSKRRIYDSLTGDRLYRNDLNTSAKKFTDVSAQAGIYQSSLGYGLGLAIADMNNDGWDDIYVGNDFHENDYYYINNGNGTFTESGAKHFNHYSRFSMGNDVADYNNDGQLDLITLDMLPKDEKILKSYGSDENPDIYKLKLTTRGFQEQFSKNCLQRNNGNAASFSETSLLSGISATDWSWCPLFADFDNDGNKDLFVSSGIVKRPVDLDYIRFVSDLKLKGMDRTDKFDNTAIETMPDGSSHPFFFKGDGKINFKDVSEEWGTEKIKGYSNGASYADLDNDGNLDVVINCINAPAVILKNNAPKKNYVSLSFAGIPLNTSGIGVKAYLYTEEKMQYQQLMLTRGFQSSSEPRLHFGLDSITKVDSLLIVWPDQKFQLIKNLSINVQTTIKQRNADGIFKNELFFPKKKDLFENVTATINIGWKHTENNFIDFNSQYLIPHMESARGPKLAVGDVNNDGLDDFFTCGTIGNPGCLMIQTKTGKFSRSDTSLFNKSKYSEDVDAVFFDANNDGFKDLYVVSGGNQYEDANPNLADRLYINDKTGHFTQSQNTLPQILFNKSCVSIGDIDKDGDNDIFIGGFANAKSYGLAQPSYLLLNDGKGNFKQADKSIINLKEAGMLTSSSFTDVNNDGWIDLIIAGEWTPVKIFINNKGIFRETEIANSTGLWQKIYLSDVDGDGSADILAGNWGYNCKLYKGKNSSLKLYVKDFDRNGSVDQVMAYKIADKEYPFLPKDELERPLPVLKKAYLTYSEVAGKTVDYIFFDLFKDFKELKAETLGSACFINDGKGNFKRVDFPEELQLAPVLAFVDIPFTKSYVEAGNFYGVLPYEGRYDALFPTFFEFNKNARAFKQMGNLPEINGEIRDMKWLNYTGGNKILLIARNNNDLVFLKPLNK